MRDKIIITCLLLATFIVSFTVVTVVMDSIEDSNDVSRGWN